MGSILVLNHKVYPNLADCPIYVHFAQFYLHETVFWRMPTQFREGSAQDKEQANDGQQLHGRASGVAQL